MQITAERERVYRYYGDTSYGENTALCAWLKIKSYQLKEEQEKTVSLKKRIIDYILASTGKGPDPGFYYNAEGNIKYFKDHGYLSTVGERNVWDIYNYGQTEDEAFMNAIIDYGIRTGMTYEIYNRERLNKEFHQRFPDNKEEYHTVFFFSEYALQQLRNYYGENIPPIIIEALESHASKYEYDTYQYSYETNSLVKKIRR